MFFATLNLSLLSLCYIGAGNQILDTGNMDTPVYNSQYDVYEISFGQETGGSYLLRYDDVTLFEIYNDISTEYNVRVGYRIEYTQNFNFSVRVDLIDEGYVPVPSYSDTFETLMVVPSSNRYYIGFSYVYDLQTGEYSNDSTPSYKLYIRLLSQETYDYVNSLGNGYQEGYDNGYKQGYDVGKVDGNAEGFENGRTQGYTLGYDTGRTDGYTQGYNTALQTHSFSFTNLFASISDTPILMIRRMFNFDIFGVSAVSILLTLFSALIFIKIIKRVV